MQTAEPGNRLRELADQEKNILELFQVSQSTDRTLHSWTGQHRCSHCLNLQGVKFRAFRFLAATEKVEKQTSDFWLTFNKQIEKPLMNNTKIKYLSKYAGQNEMPRSN